MSHGNGTTSRPQVEWIQPEVRVRPGGLRAGLLADYQIVCGAGEYELDVLVREFETPQRLEIGGQVTIGDAVYEPAPDVWVRIVEALSERSVGETRTDPFGEFLLASTPEGRLGVRLGEAEDAPCVQLWPMGGLE
ncbi:MAG: hypothetical protein QNJ98_15870 [Planctomycetota bacterium]|nr:hypothetical protein [Planctomycetota bacterium]